MLPLRLMMLWGLLTLLVAACSSQPFDRAYMASGEGVEENDLQADTQFSTTDDLNVIVKFNKHDGSLALEARFFDPNGDLMETITSEIADDIGTVVLGIDYAAQAEPVTEWLRGRYKVEISLDGEIVETLFFRVD